MSLVSVMVRRASADGMDKPAALAAAVVAGALVFVMPAGVLEQAVLASGMPDTLPQLSPPLGMKARAGLALLAAGSAFGMVLLMMRVLGFVTRKRERAADTAPVVEAAPRLRRRDRHPDAPVRAPFSVSRDMGERDEAPQPEFEPEHEHEHEPEPEVLAAPEPKIRREVAPEVTSPLLSKKGPGSLSTRRRAPLIEVLAAGAAEQAEEERVEEEAADEPFELEQTTEAEAEAEADAEAEAPEPVEAEPEPVAPAAVEALESPAPWIPTPPAEARGEPAQESLTELLARFERALERKQAARTPAPAVAEEAANEEPEGMDLRLRSALENLRRFAPRHG